MFTDLGELLEHKRNYCKLRFTCKCHTFNGTAPSTYLLERKVCPTNLPLPLYSVERKRSRLLVPYQTGLYEFHSYVSAFKKFFNKDPAFIEIRGQVSKYLSSSRCHLFSLCYPYRTSNGAVVKMKFEPDPESGSSFLVSLRFSSREQNCTLAFYRGKRSCVGTMVHDLFRMEELERESLGSIVAVRKICLRILLQDASLHLTYHRSSF